MNSPIDRSPLDSALLEDTSARASGPPVTDELGSRRARFDDDGRPIEEVLCFRHGLTHTPGFEVALRRRVELLSRFRSRHFAPVLSVEHVDKGETLALVATYTPGRRLSEVAHDAQDPAFAVSLIEQLAPALGALHDYGDGVGHGLLTATRIVIGPDGRLIMLEHVLGPAVERLRLPRTQLYLELGIPTPSAFDTTGRLDDLCDYYQLGLIALSILLGRPVMASDLADGLAKALDQVAGPEFGGARAWLHGWLSCALHINGRSFRSSAEARDTLRGSPESTEAAARWQMLLRSEPRVDAPVTTLPATPEIGDNPTLSEISTIPMPMASETPTSMPAVADAAEQVQPGEPVRREARAQLRERPMSFATPRQKESRPVLPTRTPASPVRSYAAAWRSVPMIVVALAAITAVEAVVIAVLLFTRPAAPDPTLAHISVDTSVPGASVLVDGQSAGITPLQLTINRDTRAISIVEPTTERLLTDLAVGSTGRRDDPAADPGEAPPAAVPAPAPAAQRAGGIRLLSPIPLDVFEGDRRLGSSAAGIVSAPVGRRTVELVNSVLGYRSVQSVNVRAGEVTELSVTPPEGRVNINAVPWAEVFIDGKSVGETPVGNLAVPLGEHEVVFRHPQFGERRQTIVVRLDSVTRISANLQR